MTKFATFVLIGLFTILAQIGFSQNLHKLSKDLPQLNKEFYFHVHVILDSLGNANFTQSDLAAPIAAANEYFSPIGVSFSICAWDTIHDYNFDYLTDNQELSEMRRLWSANNRINIYLHRSIFQAKCGVSKYSGISSPLSTYISLNKQCPGFLTRELGSVFGLLRTFRGSGSELVDGSNCETEGDLVCDTPADPYNPSSTIQYFDGCKFVYAGLDANGDYYQPDMGNIMSAYNNCNCGFTYGQYLRMVETYLNSVKKIW